MVSRSRFTESKICFLSFASINWIVWLVSYVSLRIDTNWFHWRLSSNKVETSYKVQTKLKGFLSQTLLRIRSSFLLFEFTETKSRNRTSKKDILLIINRKRFLFLWHSGEPKLISTWMTNLRNIKLMINKIMNYNLDWLHSWNGMN